MNEYDVVIHDVANLSSGTLAGLTGKRTYAELDRVQAKFVAFVESHPRQYETWMTAWDAFQEKDLR